MIGSVKSLRGGVIVSCQAYPGEPLRTPDTMARMAQAVAEGGAVGIRAQGLEDIRAIRAAVELPLIGLWKDGAHGVVITPTPGHAVAVARAGAPIVAVDGTLRPRPDGRTLDETIRAVHEETPALVMTDVSTYDEGLASQDLGADLVGTTLSGYTAYTAALDGPDLHLVARLSEVLSVPVIAEGRIRSPEQAVAALDRGAFAVVVGTAITHPTTLTRWFVTGTSTGRRQDG